MIRLLREHRHNRTAFTWLFQSMPAPLSCGGRFISNNDTGLGALAEAENHSALTPYCNLPEADISASQEVVGNGPEVRSVTDTSRYGAC
jgi:hypothetical protein